MNIWPLSLARAIANFEYTYVIDIDDLVDMTVTEEVAMDSCLDAFLEALKAKYPEAAPVTKKHLETAATRDIDYNRVSVVVRWNSAGVKAVYIPSKDETFMFTWPVGPMHPRFRLPVKPELEPDYFRAEPNKSIMPPAHREYEILGYDPVKNAWVYDERGITMEEIVATRRVRGTASIPGRRRATLYRDDLQTEWTMAQTDNARHLSADEVRSQLGLEKKNKPRKDLPVRESGLGIW